MRLIWNAGAAVVVTTVLTIGTSLVAPAQPAETDLAPGLVAEQVADAPHRHYTGLAEHFQAVNTSHDGRLTLDQARQAGWNRVAQHFDEIDSGHVGFVTPTQIHEYNLAHRRSHKAPGNA